MDTIKIDARDVNFWYGDFHALKGISMEIEEKSVVAFIGPSGCGKSTFLRLFNRMNDLIPATRLEGEIRIDGHNIYAKGVEVDELRKNVGMVFQRPNPFPKSIFENVAYGLRVNGVKVEELIHELKKDYTIVIVTHNMQQAARVSDKTAFFYLGEMVEYGDTKRIFTNPEKEATQNYITGRFG